MAPASAAALALHFPRAESLWLNDEIHLDLENAVPQVRGILSPKSGRNFEADYHYEAWTLQADSLPTPIVSRVPSQNFWAFAVSPSS